MASRRRDSLQRRPPSRDPRPRILVLCEGQVSEPEYVRAFKNEHKYLPLRIEIDDSGGTPKTLVKRAVDRKRTAERAAKSERDDNLRFDQVWCVFDVDVHPLLPDARQQARDNGISLAVSNPCFELWLLLHFQDQTAHVERDAALGSLKKHVRSYDKHVDYAVLRDHYEDAVRRASALDERHRADDREGANPSTTVYLLTERIKKAADRSDRRAG